MNQNNASVVAFSALVDECDGCESERKVWGEHKEKVQKIERRLCGKVKGMASSERACRLWVSMKASKRRNAPIST